MRINTLYLLALVALMSSCGRQFSVEGNFTDIPESADYIYLECLSLTGVESVDSVEANTDGTFRFKAPAPSYPDIYRIRCGNRSVVLAIDSTEDIAVSGSWNDCLSAVFDSKDKPVGKASVAKSENIRLLRRALRDSTTEAHKRLAMEIIMQNPASQAAYYALFQTRAGVPVFDIYDSADRRFYQAVATSWQVWYPESERSKALYHQVIDAINTERRARNDEAMRAFFDESESTFLDIELPDENGEIDKLSDLIGKVILLDFCSLELDGYKDYLFSLRELYNNYHSRGLEIYQVYPDRNRLLWEDRVSNLPWHTVRTENGVADLVYRTYNVQIVPTVFLYDRKGLIVGRFADFGAIDNKIKELL